MEHGSFTDPRSSTFSLTDEDHTLANSVRFTLNQDPRVEFCGYSIPHPSDNQVNIRVQTTGIAHAHLLDTLYACIIIGSASLGDPAKDVFKDALQDLMLMCQHVRSTFDRAVVDSRNSESVKQMSVD